MKKIAFLIFVSMSVLTFAQNKVPNISLTDLEGKRVNIQEMTSKDHVTVLSFWATWCMPCLKELDAISKVYPQWKEETNVEIIAVSTDDSRTVKRVKPMINGKDWDYTILLDTNHDLKRRFNITTIPHVVVVKNNTVIYRHSGYVPGAENELYEIIKENSN